MQNCLATTLLEIVWALTTRGPEWEKCVKLVVARATANGAYALPCHIALCPCSYVIFPALPVPPFGVFQCHSMM